jgi:hypothetical protein
MTDRRQALANERALFREARRNRDIKTAWHHLARAHILAQPHMVDHVAIHVQMIGFGIGTQNWQEVGGQVMRLFLAPLGNLAGRLPIGNTGLSNVSAFRPMPIPEDLAQIFARDGIPK